MLQNQIMGFAKHTDNLVITTTSMFLVITSHVQLKLFIKILPGVLQSFQKLFFPIDLFCKILKYYIYKKKDVKNI